MKILLFAMTCCTIANAQEYTRKYVFIAPTRETTTSGTTSSYAAGLGIERILRRWIGAGTELSGIVPGRGKASNAIGALAFNGYAHPVLNSRWDPYVTVGYSFLFRDFTANGFNVGGGLNYWYEENRALTLAIVEQGASHHPEYAEHHQLEFRIGLTFR